MDHLGTVQNWSHNQNLTPFCHGCEPVLEGVTSACQPAGRVGTSRGKNKAGHAPRGRHNALEQVKMAAISAVAPVLNKAPVVSTGKAANTNSMMVWQPHGNK